MPTNLAHAKDFSPLEGWLAGSEKKWHSKLAVGPPDLLWYDWGLCFDHVHLNNRGVADDTALLTKDVRDVGV
jgi:hypothetical protein